MKDEDKPEKLLIKEIKELRRRNSELEKSEFEQARAQNIISGLYNISKLVSSEANLDDLFKAIHKHVGSIVNAKNFFIGLYDKNSDLISFPYFVDEKDKKFVILKVSESGSLSSEVIKSKKPLLIKKKDFIKRLEAKELKLWGTLPEVWLGVPLRIKNEIIGVLGLQSYTTPDLYSEEDFALMESISDQIAIAIDHKRTEDELKESEERWRSVVENAPDIIITVDSEGTIKYINRTISGLNKDEVMGQKLYEYLPPDFQDTQRKSLARVFKTGKSTTYQLKGMGPDGSTSWYESRLGPIRHNGKVVAATLITTDITKRKLAQEELEKHQKNLKESVKERTEELLKANEKLQQEIKVRERAQVALRESEEKYRNLVERANDGIAIIQGAIIKYVNPALARMMGYTIDEVVGANFVNFIATDELSKVKNRYNRRIKGEDVPAVYETAFINKDGSRVDIELNAGIISFEGKPADFVLIRDIMERKQAEQKLRESEERFRLLFQNISDVVFVFNSDLILTNITPTVERMSGYKPEELIGSSFADLDFLTPESLKQAFESAEKIFAGEDLGYKLYEFVAKDGTTRFAEVNYTTVFDEDELVEIVSVARDVTERKLAEEKLRESEELYRSLVKTLPDAVYSTDLEGNFIYVSPRTLQLHGYDKADKLMGKNAFELIHPDYNEIAKENMHRTLEEGVARNLEYTLLKKDGSNFTGLLSTALIRDAHGNPKSFITTVSDISERKQVEEQIRDSLEEKEILLREIHHRVKNNIQVITSMLNLQSGHVKDKQYIESMKEIQNRIRTMALIHEKLYQSKDFAHIDFNVYIKDLINSLFRFYGVNINKIKPKIEVDGISLGIDAGIPCGLIINELVSNSLKHAFKNGTRGEIQIELRQESDDYIALIVGDNGSGFPKDIDFRKTETLGLQLVNTLVDQLGGTIELDSNGRTEFKIIFREEKK
ncbi:PAS domain S-box protein [[Eubacterium] cellulosolvens]